MGYQLLQHGLIQKMTGLLNHEMTDNRCPEDSQIPDKIQNLMPDKLVIVSQPVLIDDPEIINDNGIVKGAALGKPVFP